jgi:hypothetical protein
MNEMNHYKDPKYNKESKRGVNNNLDQNIEKNEKKNEKKTGKKILNFIYIKILELFNVYRSPMKIALSITMTSLFVVLSLGDEQQQNGIIIHVCIYIHENI